MSLLLRRARPLTRFVWALTLVAFTACASSTTIQSQPQGARVFLNGAVVGNTPYTMNDTKIVGSTTQVRLEYPGYQPLDTVIARNEELDALALVGGIFLLVPFLWIMKYQPVHAYQLQPAGAGYPSPWMGTPPAAGGYPPPPPPPAAPAPGPAGYPPPPAGYPPPAGTPPPPH